MRERKGKEIDWFKMPSPGEFVDRLREWDRAGRLARPAQVLASAGMPREVASAYGDAEKKTSDLMARYPSEDWRNPSGIFAQYFMAYHFAAQDAGVQFRPYIRAYTRFLAVNYARSLQEQNSEQGVVEILKAGGQKAERILTAEGQSFGGRPRRFTGKFAHTWDL